MCDFETDNAGDKGRKLMVSCAKVSDFVVQIGAL